MKALACQKYCSYLLPEPAHLPTLVVTLCLLKKMAHQKEKL